MKSLILACSLLVVFPLYACIAFNLDDIENINQQSVEMVDEKIAIFWHPDQQIQDHIREVSFNTSGGKFAFMVPLPSVPDIYETELIFWNVEQIKNDTFTRIPDQIEYKSLIGDFIENGIEGIFSKADYIVDGMDGEGLGSGGPPRAANARKNIVLKKVEVSGFEVNVLDMQSSVALSNWLEARSFKLNQVQEKWFSHYREKKWVLVAFEFKGNEQGNLTKTIGLRF